MTRELKRPLVLIELMFPDEVQTINYINVQMVVASAQHEVQDKLKPKRDFDCPPWARPWSTVGSGEYGTEG